jgi:hypothetical protein
MDSNRRGFFGSLVAFLGALLFGRSTEAIASQWTSQSGSWSVDSGVLSTTPQDEWCECICDDFSDCEIVISGVDNFAKPATIHYCGNVFEIMADSMCIDHEPGGGNALGTIQISGRITARNPVK